MAWIRWVACWADEHWASIWLEAVALGSPACIQARRTMLLDCSPAEVTLPPITCSTRSAGIPAREITSA